MRQKHSQSSLFIFILFCLLVEFLGSYWTEQTVSTWYAELKKPAWTPPGWVFGPVWTILYIMIAISGSLIYRAKPSHRRSISLVFYGTQLVLNCIWSFLFFFLKSPILGFIDIVLLFLLIVLTIVNSWRVRELAAILLIPYLIWVMYAGTLNWGIWLLNG